MSNAPFSQHIIKTPSNSCFLFQHWDGESVVYNNLSGETHLLEQNSAELLASIQEHPLNYNDLLKQLTTTFSNTSNEKIANYLDSTLKHFQEHGLIAPEKA